MLCTFFFLFVFISQSQTSIGKFEAVFRSYTPDGFHRRRNTDFDEHGLKKKCNTNKIKTGFLFGRSNVSIVGGSKIFQRLVGGGSCKWWAVDHVPGPRAGLEPFFQKPTKKEVSHRP